MIVHHVYYIFDNINVTELITAFISLGTLIFLIYQNQKTNSLHQENRHDSFLTIPTIIELSHTYREDVKQNIYPINIKIINQNNSQPLNINITEIIIDSISLEKTLSFKEYMDLVVAPENSFQVKSNHKINDGTYMTEIHCFKPEGFLIDSKILTHRGKIYFTDLFLRKHFIEFTFKYAQKNNEYTVEKNNVEMQSLHLNSSIL